MCQLINRLWQSSVSIDARLPGIVVVAGEISKTDAGALQVVVKNDFAILILSGHPVDFLNSFDRFLLFPSEAFLLHYHCKQTKTSLLCQQIFNIYLVM